MAVVMCGSRHHCPIPEHSQQAQRKPCNYQLCPAAQVLAARALLSVSADCLLLSVAYEFVATFLEETVKTSTDHSLHFPRVALQPNDSHTAISAPSHLSPGPRGTPSFAIQMDLLGLLCMPLRNPKQASSRAHWGPCRDLCVFSSARNRSRQYHRQHDLQGLVQWRRS